MDPRDWIALVSACVATSALAVSWWNGKRQTRAAERSAEAAEGALATSRTQAAMSTYQTNLADRAQHKADEPIYEIESSLPQSGTWRLDIFVRDAPVAVEFQIEIIDCFSAGRDENEYDLQDLHLRGKLSGYWNRARLGDVKPLFFDVINDPSEIRCDLVVRSRECDVAEPRMWLREHAVRWKADPVPNVW